MSTWVIYAAHRGSNAIGQMPEMTRVRSADVAEQIAAKLRKEQFTTHEGVRVRRYSAVRIEEIADA